MSDPKGRLNPPKKVKRITWQQAKWPIMVPKDPNANNFLNIVMVQASNSVECCKIHSDGNTIRCK